jgi:hypothetical protein
MAGFDGIQLALGELHPAFAAGAVAGAGGIDGNIGSSGQLQQIIAGVALDGNALSAFNIKQDSTHVGSSSDCNFFGRILLKIILPFGILVNIGRRWGK